MDAEEIEAKQRELRAYKRRLACLREQKALQGYSCDPKVDLEIEDIKRKIDQLSREIRAGERAQSKPHITVQGIVHKDPHWLVDPKTWLIVGLFAAGFAFAVQQHMEPLAGLIFNLMLGMIIGMFYEFVFQASTART